EFVLLRSKPTPWSPADVLALVKLQSFTMAANWDVELARLKILLADGPEALAALDPRFPDWLPVSSPPGTAAGKVVDHLSECVTLCNQQLPIGRLAGGSNNWVLASRRTKTGRPLLANDPHLGASLPAYWYLAHLRTPHLSVAGATFVGMPAFPVGHND